MTRSKKPYHYLRIVDGDFEVHYVKSQKEGVTHACVVHVPASGPLPARKHVSLCTSERNASQLALPYRANKTVVDIVKVEFLTEGEWLEAARDNVRHLRDRDRDQAA